MNKARERASIKIVQAFEVNGHKFDTEEEAQEHIDRICVEQTLDGLTSMNAPPTYDEIKTSAKNDPDFCAALIRMLDRVIKNDPNVHTKKVNSNLNSAINTMMGGSANAKGIRK